MKRALLFVAALLAAGVAAIGWQISRGDLGVFVCTCGDQHDPDCTLHQVRSGDAPSARQ